MNEPESREMLGRMRRPAAFVHRPFRQLARAWLFIYVTESAISLMMAVWIKELTGSDGAAALVFVVTAASGLLAPFVGHLADRLPRRRLLAWAHLGMVPVMLSLLRINSSEGLWLIYLVIFLYGLMGYLTNAAGSGVIRDILPDNDLGSGNGVLSTIDQGLRLVSPLVGAGLYITVGPHAVVAFAAGCFAVTSLLLGRIEMDDAAPVRASRSTPYWVEVAAGFRHLFTTRTLASLTLVITLAWAAIGLVNASIFPVMEKGLSVDPAFVGVLVSLQGAGAVIGGISAAQVVRRMSEGGTVALGLTLWALGVVSLLGTNVGVALAGMFFVGLGVTWLMVSYTTLRQRLTPGVLQGRAAAASGVAFSIPLVGSLLGTAAVIDRIDYRLLISAAVLLIAGASIPAWRMRLRTSS